MTGHRQFQPVAATLGDLEVHELRLDNGLTVLVCPHRTAPVVVCDLYYPVGSADEPPGLSGLAHFVEHMLFKGTQKFPKGQIDLLAYANAGHSNAETGIDFTHYWFELPSDRWDLALEIEADRMIGAQFDPKEVEAERQVIIEERNGDLDAPAGRLDREHQALSYLVHPYRNPILGWPEDLQRATVADLQAFYERHYHPSHALMVIVGDVSPRAAFRKVKDCFGRLPGRSTSAKTNGKRPKALVGELPEASGGMGACANGSHGSDPRWNPEPRQRGKRSFVLSEPDMVARGLMGWHSVPRGHEDSAALTVATDLLASGRRARLYNRLVEQDQLATWVDVTHEPNRWAGRLVCQVEAVPGVRPEQIEAVVREELDRLKDEGPRPDELKRTRRRLDAAWRWGREDLMSMAAGLGQFGLNGDWRLWYEELRAAQDVTARQVKDAVAEYFLDDALTVGWIVPTPEPLAKSLTARQRAKRKAQADEEALAEARRDDPSGTTGTVTPILSSYTLDWPPKMSELMPASSDASRPAANANGRGVEDEAPGFPAHREQAATIAAERAGLPSNGNWQTPLPRRMMMLEDFRPERHVLPSGLRLVTECRRGLGVVAIEMFIDGGVMRETQSGAANLLGRVLEDEAGDGEGRDWIAELEDRGGGIDVSGTGGSLRVLSEDLPLAIQAVAALLLSPRFAPGTLERAKTKVIAELRADRDDPMILVDRIFREQIYGKHPLARDPRGTITGVRNLALDDLREHHQRLFIPNNTLIVAAGDFDPDALLRLLNRHFRGWKPRELPPATLPPITRPQKPRRKTVSRPGEQAHIILGHLGVRREDPDFNSLVLLDHILGCGSGFTDRLSRVLRDELGLVYSVGGSITDSADVEPGMFRVAIGTSPDRAQGAITAAMEQIYAVKSGEFEDIEVENAKMYLSGANVFDFQTVEQRTERLLELERWSLPLDEPRHWPARLAKITPESVRAAAKAHLHPEQMVLVELGPFPDAKKLANIDQDDNLA